MRGDEAPVAEKKEAERAVSGAPAAATPEGSTAASAAASAAERERRRDIRLDFFRGLGMFIILTAHIGPWNPWIRWIPARFGFSDATEIFVFCSGAASAIAFLKVFEHRGWFIGAARIVYRIWQIYWCHIGLFFAILATLAWVDASFELSRSYVGTLNLARFVANPEPMIVGLFTLSYVPNYFDILVMYIVILALIPVIAGISMAPKRPMLAALLGFWAIVYPLALVPLYPEADALAYLTAFLAFGAIAAGLYRALEGASQPGVFVFMLGLWMLASQPWLAVVDMPVFTGLQLPAEVVYRIPEGEPDPGPRQWFFNPFAWQLIFFTGFAFAVGWLPRPPVNRLLIALALFIVLFSIPLRWWWLTGLWRDVVADMNAAIADPNREPVYSAVTQSFAVFFLQVREWLAPLSGKTFFGLTRYVHFLALAYLAWVAAGEGGSRLPSTGIGGRLVTVVRRVGQQSLAVFIFSMLLARLIGVVLSEFARPPAGEPTTFVADLTVAAANLLGYVILVGVAYTARYFRNPPWKRG